MKTYAHIIFWVIILVVLSAVFSAYHPSWQQSFYFVSMIMPVVIGTCYFFNLYLVPKYLLTKRYGLFALYSTYMLIVSLYLEMVVIFVSFIFMAQYSYDNMSPVSSDILVLALTQYFIVFFFSFILLIRKTFTDNHTISSLKDENEKYEIGQFTVRSDRQMKAVNYDDVIFIESLGDYVKINKEGEQSLMTKEKISKLGERLPDTFIRIHRSFIINKAKVTSYNREEVMLGEQQLPISRTYKKEAWERLDTNNF